MAMLGLMPPVPREMRAIEMKRKACWPWVDWVQAWEVLACGVHGGGRKVSMVAEVVSIIIP